MQIIDTLIDFKNIDDKEERNKHKIRTKKEEKNSITH